MPSFLKIKKPTNLIYINYQDSFVLILASEQLYNDIIDKCSDDKLFEITSSKVDEDFNSVIFLKHGKKFLHKKTTNYILPADIKSEEIKDIFGIV